MTPGFIQKKLLVDLNLVTGIDFDLQEYLYFNSEKLGQLRTNTSSDGISAPRITSNIIQRFGPYVASGILHDGGFRNALEVALVDGTWAKLVLDEADCNALIDEALKSEGCSWLEREIIYNALQLFGWKAFDDDRKSGNVPSQSDIAQLNTAP
jgi:hypothetical protein